MRRAHPRGNTPPPIDLPARARIVWDRLSPRLGADNHLGAAQLARYCVLFALWAEAADFVARNGPAYPIRAPGRGGQAGRVLGFREFPQAAQVRDLDAALARAESRLLRSLLPSDTLWG